MYGHPQAVGDMAEIFGQAISTYTRAQATEDGILVDVTTVAREAGFRWPAAMTRAAWEDCVTWSDADSKRQTHQDEQGRLWDVIWMASRAARRGGRGVRPRLVTLKMLCGPGDEGEPVITIMLPDED